jgi:DNA polymerase/3'-5' exonuclease PolX
MLALAEDIMDALLDCGASDASLAGSLRRGDDSPHDIDLVAVAADPRVVAREVMDGATPIRPRITSRYFVAGQVGEARVDLWIAYPAQYGAACLWATGPKGFNHALMLRAADLGLRLNAFGVWSADGDLLAGRTEAEVFSALGVEQLDPADRDAGSIRFTNPAICDPVTGNASRSILNDRRLLIRTDDGVKVRVNGEVER